MEETSQCPSRRELLAALLLFALLTLLTPSALGAHVAQLSGRELAASIRPTTAPGATPT